MKKIYKNHTSPKMPTPHSMNDDIYDPDDNLYNRGDNEESQHFFRHVMGKVKNEKNSKNDEIIRNDEI